MKLFLTILSAVLSANIIAGEECNGPHEYLYEYTPVCPLECGNLRLMRCSALMDKPSCQCKDGTVRDTKHGKCVNLNECPKYYETFPLVCNGENEHYSEYVSGCPRTCANPNGPLCRLLIHRPSCVCSHETIRDTVNGKCVPVDQCPIKIEDKPQQGSEIVCEGENEHYSETVSACPPTCAHPTGPLCAAIIRKPSCVCSLGTIRDTISGKCVKRENCSKKVEDKPQ